MSEDTPDKSVTTDWDSTLPAGTLPSDWNPCTSDTSHNISSKNDLHLREIKQKNFDHGCKKTTAILNERQQFFNMTTQYVETASALTAIGGGLLFGAPLGLICIGTGLVALAVNQQIIKYSTRKFKAASQAMDICQNRNAPYEEKKEAFTKLIKVEKGLHTWERTQNFAENLVKFAVGEIRLAIDLAFFGKEAYDRFEDRQKKKASPSHRLCGALWQMHDGLFLDCAKPEKKDKKPVVT
jgi:hypothetical protein